MRLIFAFLLATTALVSGCASIVSGTTQIVTVETYKENKPVEGANCELVNSKGTFYVSTPGTVPVKRAYGDLKVECQKEGMPVGMASVKSTTKPMAFGNVLFGGAIGVAVDTASGAAYDYPEQIQIEMGMNRVRDEPPVATTDASRKVANTAAAIPVEGNPGANDSVKRPVSATVMAAQAAATATGTADPTPVPNTPTVGMDDLRHLLATPR